MSGRRARLVLWTGPKHSGKTTAVMELADRARLAGFTVAGLAAPAIYEGGTLIGFDALDLSTGRRAVLARRGVPAVQRAGDFGFSAEGLATGHEALGARAAHLADLLIVDEFGPSELGGEGWRGDVDAAAVHAAGTVLLVVRRELSDRVAALYRALGPLIVSAADGASAVLELLRSARLH